MAGYADAAMRSVASSAGGLPALPSRAPPRGLLRPSPSTSRPAPAARPRSAASSETAPDSSQRPSSPRGEPDAEPAEDLAVRVAVRARPLVAKERLERARECLSYPDDKSVLLGQNRLFHFDDAYGPGSSRARSTATWSRRWWSRASTGTTPRCSRTGRRARGRRTRWAAARTQRPRARGGDHPQGHLGRLRGGEASPGAVGGERPVRVPRGAQRGGSRSPTPGGGYDDDGAGAPGRKKISVRERADGAIVVSGSRRWTRARTRR